MTEFNYYYSGFHPNVGWGGELNTHLGSLGGGGGGDIQPKMFSMIPKFKSKMTECLHRTCVL